MGKYWLTKHCFYYNLWCLVACKVSLILFGCYIIWKFVFIVLCVSSCLRCSSSDWNQNTILKIYVNRKFLRNFDQKHKKKTHLSLTHSTQPNCQTFSCSLPTSTQSWRKFSLRFALNVTTLSKYTVLCSRSKIKCSTRKKKENKLSTHTQKDSHCAVACLLLPLLHYTDKHKHEFTNLRIASTTKQFDPFIKTTHALERSAEAKSTYTWMNQHDTTHRNYFFKKLFPQYFSG